MLRRPSLALLLLPSLAAPAMALPLVNGGFVPSANLISEIGRAHV